MSVKKTLPERQKELQGLLATAEGKAQLQSLADRYAHDTGRVKTFGSSIITFILIHEREKGLIAE